MKFLFVLMDIQITVTSAIIIGVVLSVIGWLIGRVVWANDKEIKDLKTSYENAKEQSIAERKIHTDKIEKLEHRIFEIEIAREKQTTEIRLENQREHARLKQDFADGTLKTYEKINDVVNKLTELKPLVLNKP